MKPKTTVSETTKKVMDAFWEILSADWIDLESKTEGGLHGNAEVINDRLEHWISDAIKDYLHEHVPYRVELHDFDEEERFLHLHANTGMFTVDNVTHTVHIYKR